MKLKQLTRIWFKSLYCKTKKSWKWNTTIAGILSNGWWALRCYIPEPRSEVVEMGPPARDAEAEGEPAAEASPAAAQLGTGGQSRPRKSWKIVGFTSLFTLLLWFWAIVFDNSTAAIISSKPSSHLHHHRDPKKKREGVWEHDCQKRWKRITWNDFKESIKEQKVVAFLYMLCKFLLYCSGSVASAPLC